MFNNNLTQENMQGAGVSTGKEVMNFNSNEFGKVRTMVDEGNEPWFCLKDICDCLDIANPRDVKSRLDEDEVKILNIRETLDSTVGLTDATPTKDLGGNPNMTFVNEAGLYDVIVRSDSPKAKPFRKWVCSEVLPSIRKHGAYMTENTIEDILSNPDTLIRLATDLKKERARRQEAEKINEANAPKVRFADACLSSDSSVLIKHFALYLQKNGIKIGQLKLYEWMRKNGYLYTTGEMKNKPVQEWLDKDVSKTYPLDTNGGKLTNSIVSSTYNSNHSDNKKAS